MKRAIPEGMVHPNRVRRCTGTCEQGHTWVVSLINDTLIGWFRCLMTPRWHLVWAAWLFADTAGEIAAAATHTDPAPIAATFTHSQNLHFRPRPRCRPRLPRSLQHRSGRPRSQRWHRRCRHQLQPRLRFWFPRFRRRCGYTGTLRANSPGTSGQAGQEDAASVRGYTGTL